MSQHNWELTRIPGERGNARRKTETGHSRPQHRNTHAFCCWNTSKVAAEAHGSILLTMDSGELPCAPGKQKWSQNLPPLGVTGWPTEWPQSCQLQPLPQEPIYLCPPICRNPLLSYPLTFFIHEHVSLWQWHKSHDCNRLVHVGFDTRTMRKSYVFLVLRISETFDTL